jgi:hypothetical protein
VSTYSVYLDQLTEDAVVVETMRTPGATVPSTIRQLVQRALNEDIAPAGFDTLRARTQTLVAVGWHDLYVADFVQASQRYVQGVRRAMGYAIPARTLTSPATYTTPIRKENTP